MAPDWWPNFQVTLEHGISILNQVLIGGNYQMPYVYKAPGENLGVGLNRDQPFTLLNVEGFLQVNDLDRFVHDRASKRQGCNLLIIKKKE